VIDIFFLDHTKNSQRFAKSCSTFYIYPLLCDCDLVFRRDRSRIHPILPTSLVAVKKTSLVAQRISSNHTWTSGHVVYSTCVDSKDALNPIVHSKCTELDKLNSLKYARGCLVNRVHSTVQIRGLHMLHMISLRVKSSVAPHDFLAC
jgi:hypothetical protein